MWRLGPTGLGPGILGGVVSLWAGYPPLLLQVPVMVDKPGANLQRFLGGSPCPFSKLRDGHPHAFPLPLPLPQAFLPLDRTSRNTWALQIDVKLDPGNRPSESKRAEHPGFLAPTQEAFLAQAPEILLVML